MALKSLPGLLFLAFGFFGHSLSHFVWDTDATIVPVHKHFHLREASGENCNHNATVVADDPCATWEYEGQWGPDKWHLFPGAEICSTGLRQSPINIVTTAAIKVNSLTALNFSYPSNVSGLLLNNGHTIQINQITLPPGGIAVSLGSASLSGGPLYADTFNVAQFHIHHPAEHTVDGIAYPLEMHIVHRRQDDYAVVGVFFKEGDENLFLSQFFDLLPPDQELTTPITFDFSLLMPTNVSYWYYPGSLTTPNCSQVVTWLVTEHVQTATKAQIEKFVAIFNLNSRPVQPLNDRHVYHFDAKTVPRPTVSPSTQENHPAVAINFNFNGMIPRV